jgi:gliding motility-associated-like protein
MMYRLVLTICLLFWSTLTLLEARHIVGGEITYECKGGGIYEFTMKIYRDPFGGGAFFDDPAAIAIYRCGVSTPCGSLNPVNAYLTLNVPVQQVKEIENPTYPCLTVPPNIRVEEGIYRFTVNLPPSTENYHIVYQRCCRNNTINNIYNPEDTGASFNVEITTLAQQLCNSSPVFTGFPPTVICVGEPINFLHDATDPDGDQLVYSFCAPVKGGGPILNGPAVTGCNGVIPTPPCPPPFPPVDYILPTYSPTAPLAGDPVVSIDPVTGLITGIPEVQGQFVVGVCVSEYRNGQLLSVIRRDFQFNVTSCQATVVADIQKDETIGFKSFLINSCGENTIRFQNRSYQTQNIFGYQWTFDVGGQPVMSTDKDPVITFPGPGQYSGKLLVNPNSNCSDSATIFVNVFPSIDADFGFVYDTCVAGEVAFTDLSQTGSGIMTNWSWTFGDGTSSSQQNPSHLYASPGNKPVTLRVRDINACTDSITRIVPWFPVPPLLIIQPSAYQGCQPASIFFNNLSSPIDSTYTLNWTFGDGATGGAISPNHIYTEPGIYTITLEVISPIGCRTEAIFSDLIVIEPSPIAAFSFSPTTLSNLNSEVRFTDLSSGASTWFWQFDNKGTSKLPNPVFVFPDTGLQQVILTVTHPSGCQDTAMALLDVVPEVRYHMPNAFSPNGDGRNDFFIGRGLTDGMKDFRLIILNRWGEQIFETEDPQRGWDGTYPGSDRIAPPGVYVWLLTYADSRGNRFELKGFATLLQ